MGEADPANVGCFRLDKYLVTLGRFRQFVDAWNGGAGYTPPDGSGKHTYLNGGKGLINAADDAGIAYESGWVTSDDGNIAPTASNLTTNCTGLGGTSFATWTASVGSNENLPIDCVNWYEAYAFCIWDGGFLPSEAEWEYAAAGGSQQREYPWGSTDPSTNNQYTIYGDGNGDCYYPTGALVACTGVANIAPEGTATLGAGLWGQLDLAGEVYEWNLDWYVSSYINPCTDCAYLTEASFRVARGGNFNSDTSHLRPPARDGFNPALRDDGFFGSFLGVRCARAP
jgi:formylglycine-generating enzyme required for sulfatase activity